MMEEPEQPEGEGGDRINPVPDATPEGVPGEPGEATPADGAPAEDAPADEAPADPEAPGPEIEGLEELADGGQGLTPEGSDPPSPEASDAPSDEQPAAEQSRERGGRPAGDGEKGKQEDVIPGLHLEPDLVLEEQRQEGAEGAYGEYDQYADADGGDEEQAGDDAAEPAPVAHTPLELAADA